MAGFTDDIMLKRRKLNYIRYFPYRGMKYSYLLRVVKWCQNGARVRTVGSVRENIDFFLSNRVLKSTTRCKFLKDNEVGFEIFMKEFGP